MNVLTSSVLRTSLFFLVINVYTSLSVTIKFNNNIPNIVSKRKIELKPVIVNCLLNDLVRISVPVITEKDQYYLSKPNGDVIKLDLRTKKLMKNGSYKENPLTITFKEKSNAILQQSDNFDVFSVKKFHKKLKYLEPNDFLIGPLIAEDYGNWVLSIFTKNSDGEWIELFQTFTLAITEYIILEPRKPKLHIGDDFNLSFAFPIPAIESCEIIAPRSTFDRFYTRNNINFNKCGFVIPNITKADEGIWRIIGIGRVAYEGVVKLYVIDPDQSGT